MAFVPQLSVSCTVTSVSIDNGLVRNRTITTWLFVSLTLYDDWLKLTPTTVKTQVFMFTKYIYIYTYGHIVVTIIQTRVHNM